MQNKTLIIVVVLSFLVLSPWHVAAQESSKGHSGEALTPSTVIIIVMAIIFLFTGCLAVFLRRFADGCFGLHIIPTNYPDSIPEGRVATKGLDADVIKSLPTYLYADVKQHRKVGQVELECAVCLNEFQDPEALRLLPGCSHVFHPRCIDRWLAGHVTCPVCRQSLLETAAESGNKQAPHSIINITEEAAAVAGQQDFSSSSSSDVDNEADGMSGGDAEDEGVQKKMVVGKFSRSHSTGHSIRIMGSAERYTLVLPAEYRDEDDHIQKNNLAGNDSHRSKKGLLSTCMVSPRSGYKCGWFPMTPPLKTTPNSYASLSVRTLVSSSLFKSSSFKNLAAISGQGERQLV